MKQYVKYIVALAACSLSGVGLHALTPITAEKFDKFALSYKTLQARESVTCDEAEQFVESLLGEVWELGSDRSARMSQWVADITQKAGLDTRQFMPDKVELTDNMLAAMRQAITAGLQQGAMSVGAAMLFNAISGGVLTVPIVVAAVASGGIAGIIGSYSDHFFMKEVNQAPRVGVRALFVLLAQQALTYIPGQYTALPEFMQLIPLIGNYLVGEVVPGWMVLAAGGMVEFLRAEAVHAAMKSSWLHQLWDRACQAYHGLLEASDDPEFLEQVLV